MSIVVDSLSHTYHPGTPLETRALTDVSLEMDHGRWISVAGHTGSGKSTLAQHLNGLIYPQRGSVTVDGKAVREKGPDLREIRRKVGFVFQYPEQQLFAETVFEEIAFAPRNWGVPEEEISSRVASALSLVGLDEGYLARSPFHLSGGEKRKIAIASVLSGTPGYLVLDEPTAGLDSFSRKELVLLLKRLQLDGMGVLLVTHDLDIALQASDSILILEKGRQVLTASPLEVIQHLQSRPLPGLFLPDIPALSAALRTCGRDVPLTWDWKILKKALIGEQE